MSTKINSTEQDKQKKDKKTLEDYIDVTIQESLDNKFKSFRESVKKRLTTINGKLNILENAHLKIESYSQQLSALNSPFNGQLSSFGNFHISAETQTLPQESNLRDIANQTDNFAPKESNLSDMVTQTEPIVSHESTPDNRESTIAAPVTQIVSQEFNPVNSAAQSADPTKNNLGPQVDDIYETISNATAEKPIYVSDESMDYVAHNISENVEMELSGGIIDLTCEEKSLHPKLILKVTKHQQGFELLWYSCQDYKFEEIIEYEIYSANDRPNLPNIMSNWNLLGKVKSLKLPMVCSLCSFNTDLTYSFTVRSVARDQSFGPFSTYCIVKPDDLMC